MSNAIILYGFTILLALAGGLWGIYYSKHRLQEEK